MKKLGRYIGQRLNKLLPQEKILVLELLSLIRSMYLEREKTRERLRAIKRRVYRWTQVKANRESQLIWDLRIREALQKLEHNRRAEIGNLPEVIERAIVKLAGEVCGEIVQGPEWLHRDVQRLLGYLECEFPYLNCDEREPLVIAVRKGSSLGTPTKLEDSVGTLRNVIIIEDGSLKAGDLRVMREGIGLTICRSKVIADLRGEESVLRTRTPEDVKGVMET